MKSVLMLMLACICTLSLQATIITVDNNSISGGQYTDLQLAIDNATAGDTIQVIGSLTSYGTVTLDKQLTIIGAGYNSPNQFNLSTSITTIFLGQSLPDNSSGSKIMGCKITSLSWSVSASFSNITVERCEIGTINMITDNATGWVIQNCIINSLNLGNNANIVVRNNIITTNITTSNEPNVLITNNLFNSSFSSGACFSNISAAVITNNIFYQGRTPQGCTLSNFNNNITFGTMNDQLPYGNNSGAGNLVTIDPQFANIVNTGFDYDNDYRMNPGSPGINAGTDGTDIGIYGGITPFPIGGSAPYITSAPPSVPQIMEITILNATLFQGDTLTVQVRARKQD